MKSFDEETRAILSDAAFNAARKERKISVQDIPNILAECDEKGVAVVRMNAEEKAKFVQITSKVYDMYQDYFTAGLVDRLKAA
jgi:TRAP-type C4-dicarboxylate transport system substrate-binding protein